MKTIKRDRIQFIDLATQQSLIKSDLERRLGAVLAHGKYIMGPEVVDLEKALCSFSGAKHCISCANGTDALLLSLMALGVGANDAVFVPAFTFAGTAEMIPHVNATPVFVDIDPLTFNIDIGSLQRSIEHSIKLGLNPKAIIPVDLFGLPADYENIQNIAAQFDMKIISDSAQGFGSKYKDRRSGTFGDISTTSFFPAKPLGCYGDGGAVFTEDEAWADTLRSIRVHGKGANKYDNIRLGLNSRLDTIQAAILLCKLAIFENEIDLRQRNARFYTSRLEGFIAVPTVPANRHSAWAQFTLRAPSGPLRQEICSELNRQGVPTNIYYPATLNELPVFKDYPVDPHGVPESKKAADTVFSLPSGPYIERDDIEFICDIVLSQMEAVQ